MDSSILLEMPGLYGLKPAFQRLLRPAAGALARAGVRANHVTVAACGISVALGATLLLTQDWRMFLLLPMVLLLRMALNALDGMLAREFAHQSALGGFLNELGDVVSDTFLYLPFAHLRGFSPFWVWNVVLLAVISEMTGTVAAAAGASRRYDGPMGKSDRAAVFGALGLWAGLAGGLPAAAGFFVPKVMVILLVLTIANRVRKGVQEVKENGHASL